MNLITRITSDAYQQQTLVLDDGTAFTMTMYFHPLQNGWFLTNLTYEDFVINEMRICNSPNMLFQWQNKIPFGLACYTTGNREPFFQDDFFTGVSKLYILSEDEVEEYSAFIRGG